VKEEKTAARNDNNKVDASNNLYSRLQFEKLFSHLPASILLHHFVSPTLSGSTSEHRRSTEHRGSEHRNSTEYQSSIEHRSSNDQRGFNKHRGSTEHQGSTRFNMESCLATYIKIRFTRKQPPINRDTCYDFIIRGINVDATVPYFFASKCFRHNVTVPNNHRSKEELTPTQMIIAYKKFR
jgi:hypothetical protein